jgi:hypothetical protein
LSDSESQRLIAKLKRGIDAAAKLSDASAMRSRAFAAIALADHVPDLPERELRNIVQKWWRGPVTQALRQGRDVVPRNAMYPMIELLHAIRDNLNIDLRESAGAYFRDLPAYRLLSYYPSPYPAAENEYRIPAYKGSGEPHLEDSALSRATDLAMVAYDSNSRESAFLQGWLIHDRFLLRGMFGIVYEFLWANPYQPGLSYYHMPLQFHDPQSGRLFLRSAWEEDASWFGIFDGQFQLFREGRVSSLNPLSQKSPLELGEATVLFGSSPLRFSRKQKGAELYYLVGLKPNTRYEIEVDDEEIREEKTDAGGTLILKFLTNTQPAFRMREAAPPAVAASPQKE